MAREIKEGQRAPAFRTASTGGGELALEDLRGRWVVLYFYPKDNTSGCTREAEAFRDGTAELEARNATVVGVSKDSLKSHESFAAKLGLAFPLLSDPEGKLIGAFGAWKGEPGGGIDRATFLIDPEGVVRRIWRHVKVDGHREAVLAALDELS